jgi:cystathionine gamma-synthase
VVRLGRPEGVPGAALNPPVVLSAPFHQGGEAAYGRDSNPTWEALEEAIGGLEGGSAVAFASGLAAVAAVIETLPVPGVVVLPGDAYSGTRRFLADVAGRGRLSFRVVDVADTAATLRACEEVARQPDGAVFGSGGLLWLESPTNPLLAVADLGALAEGAHRLGMDVVVDNTFATPLAQQPLALGADAVVHSATKFLSGHSDVLCGAVVSRRADLVEALAARRSLHGAIPGPWEAWIVLRGIRTLDVRMERSQANAAELARRLAAHPAVVRVLYPGLPSHPGHDLAARQMSGFGAMVSFELPSATSADTVVGGLELLTAATSLGGVETLIERRARWEAEEHVPPGLLRMSVGIEDVDDLWEDLERALSSSL